MKKAWSSELCNGVFGDADNNILPTEARVCSTGTCVREFVFICAVPLRIYSFYEIAIGLIRLKAFLNGKIKFGPNN